MKKIVRLEVTYEDGTGTVYSGSGSANETFTHVEEKKGRPGPRVTYVTATLVYEAKK